MAGNANLNRRQRRIVTALEGASKVADNSDGWLTRPQLKCQTGLSWGELNVDLPRLIKLGRVDDSRDEGGRIYRLASAVDAARGNEPTGPGRAPGRGNPAGRPRRRSPENRNEGMRRT